MNQHLIEAAFKEDLPSGDVTTSSLGQTEKFGLAKLIAKQDLSLSGTEIFTQALHYIDPDLEISWHFKRSDRVLSGQSVAQISGNLISLIKAERVALNFLGFLSGIATQAYDYSQACSGTTTQILDTRKTLPLYRELSKQAVTDGGAKNHRMSLSDAILIKENHIAIAGDLETCFTEIRKNSTLPIEIEVQNLEEVKKAVELKADRIMLDNMTNEQMKECLAIIPKNIESEASGNMTLERIASVASLGVTYISVGAITHSAKNADFSLLFDWS